MDSESSSTNNTGKDKVDSFKSRRTWTKKEEESLIAALLAIVKEGWKVDNAFTAGYLTKLEGNLNKSLPGTDLRGNPHIESKLKTWKKHFNCVQAMLSLSGFGWNDVDKTVDVESNSVWGAFVKKEVDAKYLRNKSFPYYDSWIQIFGKDRATDDGAKNLTIMAEEPLDNEEVFGDWNIFTMNFPTLDPFAVSVESHEFFPATSAKSKSKKRPRVRDDVATSLVGFGDKIGELIFVTNDKLEFIGKRMGYALIDELRKLPLPVDERLDV